MELIITCTMAGKSTRCKFNKSGKLILDIFGKQRRANKFRGSRKSRRRQVLFIYSHTYLSGELARAIYAAFDFDRGSIVGVCTYSWRKRERAIKQP
jgi:hypothetical protein